MATNQSNKEKTMKSMMSQLSLDVWTLDNLETCCNYKNMSILPTGLLLDEYRDYFEVNEFLEEVDLPKKYHYAPAMFAEDYYGTPDLDFLVLYFAKKTTLFEFNTKKIIMLKPERLKDINKIILSHREEIKEMNENPPKYLG